MRKITIAAVLTATCVSSTVFAEKNFRAEVKKLTDGCWSGPDYEMNECAKQVLDKIDNEMNRKYRRLMFGLHNSKSLLKAQRAWIVFRDAECSTDYPSITQPQSNYAGEYLCKLELTLERNQQLDWRISNDCIGEPVCPELPKVQQGVQADVHEKP